MAEHKHAEVIKAWADGAEIQIKSWEGKWLDCEPQWVPDREYRVKPVPLCQIEGRDVFQGDKLWWKARNEWVIVGGKFANSDSHLRVGSHDSAWSNDLSWTEPVRTKTMYQWAILRPNESKWFVSDWLYSTEQEVREQVVAKEVRRLDWTALEVPA